MPWCPLPRASSPAPQRSACCGLTTATSLSRPLRPYSPGRGGAVATPSPIGSSGYACSTPVPAAVCRAPRPCRVRANGNCRAGGGRTPPVGSRCGGHDPSSEGGKPRWARTRGRPWPPRCPPAGWRTATMPQRSLRERWGIDDRRLNGVSRRCIRPPTKRQTGRHRRANPAAQAALNPSRRPAAGARSGLGGVGVPEASGRPGWTIPRRHGAGGLRPWSRRRGRASVACSRGAMGRALRSSGTNGDRHAPPRTWPWGGITVAPHEPPRHLAGRPGARLWAGREPRTPPGGALGPGVARARLAPGA